MNKYNIGDTVVVKVDEQFFKKKDKAGTMVGVIIESLEGCGTYRMRVIAAENERLMPKIFLPFAITEEEVIYVTDKAKKVKHPSPRDWQRLIKAMMRKPFYAPVLLVPRKTPINRNNILSCIIDTSGSIASTVIGHEVEHFIMNKEKRDGRST